MSSASPIRRFVTRPDTLFISALIIFAVVVVTGVTYVSDLRHELDDRLAAIHARGEPMTLEELDAYIPQPIGPNAADIYLEAFDALNSVPPRSDLPLIDDIELPPLGNKIPIEMVLDIKDHIAAQEVALELLAEAALIEECRFPTQSFNLEVDITTPLSHLRTAMNLHRLRSAVLAQDGDVDDAVNSLVHAIHPLQAMHNESGYIGDALRRAFLKTLSQDIERLCSTSQLSISQIESLRVAFERAYRPDSVHYGFITERAFSWGWQRTQESHIPLYRLPDEVRMLEMYERIDEATQADPRTRRDISDEIHSDIDGLSQFMFLKTKMLAPGLMMMIDRGLSFGSPYPLIMTLLSIEQYQIEQGQLPQSLKDLPQNTSIDPNIGYTQLNPGYEIFINEPGQDPANPTTAPLHILTVLRN